jgi:hypothetical protein
MPGLVPGIHVLFDTGDLAGTSLATTKRNDNEETNNA